MKYVTVGVVGAGVMGTGLAQNLAQTGHQVVLVDIGTHILQAAQKNIVSSLRFASLFNPEVRDADHAEILTRIEYTTEYDRLSNVDFLIENTTESWEVKSAVYALLDETCRPDCILAANASAISISRIASATRRPAQVIGMHFMNPVPQKKIVEVIKGLQTSEETISGAHHLLQQMRKEAVVVKDAAGFVSNRVLMLTINEAISVVQDGIASPPDVDKIFVKGFAHKMGPLATADLIGLDTILRTLEVLYESYNDPKYRPCQLLKQMVDAGLHGRKSGAGFFNYAGKNRATWM